MSKDTDELLREIAFSLKEICAYLCHLSTPQPAVQPAEPFTPILPDGPDWKQVPISDQTGWRSVGDQILSLRKAGALKSAYENAFYGSDLFGPRTLDELQQLKVADEMMEAGVPLHARSSFSEFDLHAFEKDMYYKYMEQKLVAARAEELAQIERQGATKPSSAPTPSDPSSNPVPGVSEPS